MILGPGSIPRATRPPLGGLVLRGAHGSDPHVR